MQTREQKHAYYLKNKERLLASAAVWYLNHKQDAIKKAIERYHLNPDKQKKYSRDYKKRNPEKMTAYMREWYRKNGRSRTSWDMEKILEWGAEHPDRIKIQKQTRYYIKTNNIKRPSICPKCGVAAKVQAHHVDYDHYSHYIWLCSSCHKKEHNKTGGSQ